MNKRLSEIFKRRLLNNYKLNEILIKLLYRDTKIVLYNKPIKQYFKSKMKTQGDDYIYLSIVYYKSFHNSAPLDLKYYKFLIKNNYMYLSFFEEEMYYIMDGYDNVYNGRYINRDKQIRYLEEMIILSFDKNMYKILKAVYKYKKMDPYFDFLVDYTHTDIKMTEKWQHLAHNTNFAIKYRKTFHETFFKPRFMNNKWKYTLLFI
jgi:hypothetical protein